MPATQARTGWLVLCVAVCGVVHAAAQNRPATDRWYTWGPPGKPCGYFHVVATRTDRRDAPLRFVHDFVVSYRGRRLSLHMETRCRDDSHFTPVRITSRGEGDDELRTYDATITTGGEPPSGVMRPTMRGGKCELTLPPNTVPDFVIFEIIRRLPFKRGAVFQFHSLEASELHFKPGHKIAYLGKEAVAAGARALHKFEQTGPGIRPAQYWVDEGHELVRILIDGRKEFLLTTKDQALKTLGSEP